MGCVPDARAVAAGHAVNRRAVTAQAVGGRIGGQGRRRKPAATSERAPTRPTGVTKSGCHQERVGRRTRRRREGHPGARLPQG